MQTGQPSSLRSMEVDVSDALNQLSPNSKLKDQQRRKQGLSPDKNAPNSSLEQENAYQHDDTKKVSTCDNSCWCYTLRFTRTHCVSDTFHF
jgi:hypothetical protein